MSANADRKSPALALLPVLLLIGSVDAFQTSTVSPISPSTILTHRGSRGRSQSHLRAAPFGDLPIGTLDPQELATHAHAVQGFVQQHTSLFLSDAAAANPMDAIDSLDSFEATEAALVESEGWWAAYLNLYKTLIVAIHSGIDGPVHKLGWQGGTWGFSIALFTAGKSSLVESS